jgi:hypothetical protein
MHVKAIENELPTTNLQHDSYSQVDVCSNSKRQLARSSLKPHQYKKQKMAPSQPCDPDPDSDPSTAPDSKISTTASIQYWNAISPDVNGMLGGFPQSLASTSAAP